MSISAYYHNGCCENEKKRDFLLQLDYVGIAVMISGSTVAPFYYGLMCETHWYLLYSLVVWLFCIAAAIMIMSPEQMKTQATWISATVWVCAALSCVPAVIHMQYVSDRTMLHHMDLWPWMLGGFFYILGAVIYSFKWPECFAKGRFDFIGNSHNIFHVCIVFGAVAHWYGSVRVFHERQMYQCPV